MDTDTKRALVEYLEQYITPEKWQKIQSIARDRTRYVTVVLENIRQELNMSAALRSIECFGLQDAYVIDSHANKTRVRPKVTKGSDQWLTIKRYRGHADEATLQCFEALKAEGYRIVATMPHVSGQYISQVPLDTKIALVFGSESSGISTYAQAHADAYAAIPMYGFTQSFNVASSVGMCLYDLMLRLRTSAYPWHLSDDERVELYYQWIKKMVRHADLIEKRYWEEVKLAKYSSSLPVSE